MNRPAAGFTLIEVMGAFLVTIVVMLFVIGTFRESGRQQEVALEKMRVETTASAALDLLAQDLEGALYLTRAESRDARDHPWLFLAEDVGELGARTLRFQTQNVARGNLGEHASTWVDVVYFLTEEEADPDSPDVASGPSYTLWRWRSLRPPTDAARRLPNADDARSARVAQGLADFGATFADLEGNALDDWDSSLGTGEAPLPVATEIRLSLYEQARHGQDDGSGANLVPGRVRARSVALPMNQPIDIAALVATEIDDAEADCATISDCADIDDEWFVDLVEADCDGDADLCDLLNASTTTCWSEIEEGWASVAASAPSACEDLP
ncbi:MAG: type II secretion system GspH family protein [bacterium]|nr:type II secretion system GspH family protein [bacterium]